jgi:hypothetical protein
MPPLLAEADGLASASAPREASLGAPREALGAHALGELNPTLRLYPGVDSPRAVGAPRAATVGAPRAEAVGAPRAAFGCGEALPWPLPPQRALAGAQFACFTSTKVHILVQKDKCGAAPAAARPCRGSVCFSSIFFNSFLQAALATARPLRCSVYLL